MASILVSEADPDVRRLLIVLMERLGHEAIALDRNVEVPPRGDLLLLEPGAEWCLRQAHDARLLFPELPIISMGALSRDSTLREGGPLVFIEKPFSVDALQDAVSALTSSPV